MTTLTIEQLKSKASNLLSEHKKATFNLDVIADLCDFDVKPTKQAMVDFRREFGSKFDDARVESVFSNEYIELAFG